MNEVKKGSNIGYSSVIKGNNRGIGSIKVKMGRFKVTTWFLQGNSDIMLYL